MRGIVAAIDAAASQIDDYVGAIKALCPRAEFVPRPVNSLPVARPRKTRQNSNQMPLFMEVTGQKSAHLSSATRNDDMERAQTVHISRQRGKPALERLSHLQKEPREDGPPARNPPGAEQESVSLAFAEGPADRSSVFGNPIVAELGEVVDIPQVYLRPDEQMRSGVEADARREVYLEVVGTVHLSA